MPFWFYLSEEKGTCIFHFSIIYCINAGRCVPIFINRQISLGTCYTVHSAAKWQDIDKKQTNQVHHKKSMINEQCRSERKTSHYKHNSDSICQKKSVHYESKVNTIRQQRKDYNKVNAESIRHKRKVHYEITTHCIHQQIKN